MNREKWRNLLKKAKTLYELQCQRWWWWWYTENCHIFFNFDNTSFCNIKHLPLFATVSGSSATSEHVTQFELLFSDLLPSQSANYSVLQFDVQFLQPTYKQKCYF
jgi:hypothetical protein